MILQFHSTGKLVVVISCSEWFVDWWKDGDMLVNMKVSEKTW